MNENNTNKKQVQKKSSTHAAKKIYQKNSKNNQKIHPYQKIVKST